MKVLKYAKTWVMWLLLLGSVWAQEWGEMQLVLWENPPMAYPGYFNPSYCDADSLLYFDTYFRLAYEDSKIYSSKLIYLSYPYVQWSDPIEVATPINIDGYSSIMAYINAGGDSMFFSSNRPRQYMGRTC